MSFLRGEIIISSIGGINGKPRPWVVVQTNLLNETLFTILAAPLSSEVKIEQEEFRPILKSNKDNGLKNLSQIMLDRTSVLENRVIEKKIGALSKKEIQVLNQAIAFVFGL